MTVTFDDILAARDRIAGQVDRTPVRYSRKLSQLTGAEVWIKYDNLHFTGSFKERGALNRLLQLSPDERRRGVVAASAGNHAQALAYHGARLGVPVTIVMPEGTPFVKADGTRAHGATVVIKGADFSGSTEEAHRFRDEDGMVFISAFDDAGIVAGQGVCGLEFMEDAPDLDVLIVPIGGGGLIAGTAIAAKGLKPSIRIFGVEAIARNMPPRKRRIKAVKIAQNKRAVGDRVRRAVDNQAAARIAFDKLTGIKCADDLRQPAVE